MHEIMHTHLAELFDFLQITPTPRQIEEFKSDIQLLNPLLFKETIQSIVHSKGLSQTVARDYRKLVLSVYHRKAKDLVALSRYLFVFESALRATVASELEEMYGSTGWWLPIKAAMEAGALPKTVSGFNSEQASSIAFILWTIDGGLGAKFEIQTKKLDAYVSGAAILSQANLAPLGKLIQAYWHPCFMKHFNQRGRLALTKKNFGDQFKLVLETRNSAYHHRPVSKRDDAIRVMISMLSYLNLNLEDEVTSIAAAT